MKLIINNPFMSVLLFLVAAPTVVDCQDGTIDFFSIISDAIQGQGKFRCGGSLIYDDILLTASFCSGAGDIIRVGYKDDDTALAIRKAQIVVNHPDAGNNQENLPNDLAVVKLNASVTGITPIALNKNMANPANRNQTVYVAHAGLIPDIAPTFTIGLIPFATKFSTEVQTPILFTYPFRLCFQEYKNHRKYYRSDPEKDLQFCAIPSPTQGPCDSGAWGSPMWDMVGGLPVLVGMASQGSCTPGNPPYLFTRIFTYVEWIQGQICALSDHPPDYCFEEP